MVHNFPYTSAFLSRTKLSYINLPGLLSDAKRDRSGRVTGFVAIHIGEVCNLLFVREGLPFHAARIRREERCFVPIAEVIRTTADEIDRGEVGQIGYYGAPEAQLRAMLSTVAAPAVPLLEEADRRHADRLFPALREHRFNGVLELGDTRGHHYLLFRDGGYTGGYFCGRDAAVPVAEMVRSIFASEGGVRVSLYDLLPELPVQAPPGLADVYRALVEGIARELAEALGNDEALTLLESARARAEARHPVVSAFEVAGAAVETGGVVEPAEVLTDGVGAWLTEVLGDAADRAGLDPAEVLERAAGDRRFALLEQGFFRRLPWPVSL